MMIVIIAAATLTAGILLARELKYHKACLPETYRCTYCGRPLPTERSLNGSAICKACYDEDRNVTNLASFEREC